MLSRFLDWLDEAAAGLIRVAYLLAGVTAVAVYFGAGHLPTFVQDALNGTLPWVLSFSVETHTYLSARRVRSAWQDMQASPKGSPEHDKAVGALKVNLGVLAFLVAFSCWNQLNYLYDTWMPPHTALALPGWLNYVVRALVIPAAFMCAAFLAPLALPIAAQIEQEARATLADVFKIARRQRRKMLQLAEREGRDMTGALVELVTDNELRRVISHAYRAIAITPAMSAVSPVVVTEHSAILAAPDTAPAPAVVEEVAEVAPTSRTSTNDTPDRPPTGPGSPAAAPRQTTDKTTRAPRPAVLRLEPAERAPRKTAARARTAQQKRRATTRGRQVRTGDAATSSYEDEAKAAWANGARSITKMMRATGMSRAAASSWVRTFKAGGSNGGSPNPHTSEVITASPDALAH